METKKLVAYSEAKEKFILSNYFAMKSNISQLELTKISSGAGYDMKAVSGNTSILLEAKIRTYTYNDVSEKGGVYIETTKYRKIVELAEKEGRLPLYFNYYSDGFITIHVLSNDVILSETKVYVPTAIEEDKMRDRYVLDMDKCDLIKFNLNQKLIDNDKLFLYIAEIYTNPEKIKEKLFFQNI